MGYRGYGATWAMAMGYMGNVDRDNGVQGVWVQVMGHMGNGAQWYGAYGQWGTWVMWTGTMGYRGYGYSLIPLF